MGYGVGGINSITIRYRVWGFNPCCGENRGCTSPRFAKSGNPREIYFSPRFLDFRRRRGIIIVHLRWDMMLQKGRGNKVTK